MRKRLDARDDLGTADLGFGVYRDEMRYYLDSL